MCHNVERDVSCCHTLALEPLAEDCSTIYSEESHPQLKPDTFLQSLLRVPPSFIHIVSIYQVPVASSILGTGDVALAEVPVLMEFIIWWSSGMRK